MKTQIEALALSAAVLFAAVVTARAECPKDLEGCVVEDWVVRGPGAPGYSVIEGTTTCKSARVYLRVYDKVSGRWLGNGQSRVDGYTFSAAVPVEVPATRDTLVIRFAISPAGGC